MLFAETNLTQIVAICVPVGGAFVTWMITSVAAEWRKAKVAEYRAILIQGMVDKGFSPGEVERVLKAADAGRDRMSCKSRLRDAEPAHS